MANRIANALKSGYLLLAWLPYFALLAATIEWRWRTFTRMFSLLVDFGSGRTMHINVLPWGPEPNARAGCVVWALFVVFGALYSGAVRVAGLRCKQSYTAFILPFSVIFSYITYCWIHAFYVLKSYILQLGMTPAREEGLWCLGAGLILWLAYAAMLCFPWEKRLRNKTGSSFINH